MVSHCKNVCSYCPQSLLIKQYGRKEYMTLDNFRIILSKLPKNVNIDFSGYAECFLNPDASTMMLEAFKAGYRLRLFTTLVGITDKDIDIIKNISFAQTVLHLPDYEGHMKATVDDEYLRLAKRFKHEVGYHSAHCFGTLPDVLISIFNNCVEEPIDNQHIHTRANNLGDNTIDKLGLLKHNYTSGPITCGVIYRERETRFNHNVVLPNGQVQLCCMLYGLEHPIGNLLTDTYESLFTSEGYLRVMQGLTDESIGLACRNCKETYPIEAFKYD